MTAAEELPHIDLSIPDIAGLDRVGAAIAYAEAGWYVVPAKAGTKNPGSVLGKGWDHQSSRDPQTIAAWFAGTNHEICLHMGRSGALGIDIDDPDKAPDVLIAANKFRKPPVQQTRPESQPHRAHVIYAIPPGRRFGNGVGQLGQGWGEIRGDNGVLLVGPAADDRAWFRIGAVPDLPAELAELLPTGAPSERAATDMEVSRFLTTHDDGDRYDLLAKLADVFERHVEAGESRHQSMISLAAGAMKEAKAGYYSARAAAGTLESMFLEAVTIDGHGKQGGARTDAEGRSEWLGILSWAVGQAEATQDAQTRQRVAQHAESAPEPTELDVELDTDVEAAFWGARPILRHIHRFARARRAQPWAVFGVTLARILTATEPTICLPPIIGGRGSLNTFVGLVGPSGGGKGIATAAAKDAVLISDIKTAKLASGEAIAHLYKRPLTPKERREGGNGDEWICHARLIDIAEIDQLAAQQQRQGSTLMANLRSAWSGELLGQVAADPSRSFLLEPHQYRLCLVAGIQPNRALVLLEDEDGGTPQRFIWLPVLDRQMPDEPPECPNPISWEPPALGELIRHNGAQLEVASSITDEIDAAHVARNRGEGDPLDGHRYQSMLKVAAGLGLADGRLSITEEDWQLARVVMRKSDGVRARVVEALKAKRKAEQEAAADNAAQRAVKVEQTIEEAAIKRVCDSIRRRLSRESGDGWLARNDLRGSLRSTDRRNFEAAVERLIESAVIESGATEGRQNGTRFRLRKNGA